MDSGSEGGPEQRGHGNGLDQRQAPEGIQGGAEGPRGAARGEPRTPEGARGEGSSPELISRGAVRPELIHIQPARDGRVPAAVRGRGRVSGKALGLYLG